MVKKFANVIQEEFHKLTGISISANFMEKGKNHSPTTLQKGKQGVYVFLIGETCLKVGKAGPKSKARWNSHHYNLDETTPSALPKSIINNKDVIKKLFNGKKDSEIDILCQGNIKDWMKENTSRIEFIMDAENDGFSLNLLEALVQFRLNPVFEGRRKIKL